MNNLNSCFRARFLDPTTGELRGRVYLWEDGRAVLETKDEALRLWATQTLVTDKDGPVPMAEGRRYVRALKQYPDVKVSLPTRRMLRYEKYDNQPRWYMFPRFLRNCLIIATVLYGFLALLEVLLGALL